MTTQQASAAYHWAGAWVEAMVAGREVWLLATHRRTGLSQWGIGRRGYD